MPQPPAIECTDVSYRYHDTPVLEGVSFSVQQGEYVGVIGPNGSGKTTLLKLLLGLLRPDRGEIRLFGKPISRETLHHIGYIPQRMDQGDVLFPATVEEIVQSGHTSRQSFFQRLTHRHRGSVHRALEIANIQQLGKRRFGDLSGGQRQRVLIARALVSEPKLLILDEPTVGVDIRSQEQFYHFLEQLNHKHGITIMLVTHEIDVVANEARTLLCVNRGITYHGTPKEFIKGDYLEQLYGKNVKMILHNH